ncbi:MAG: hypothetical protein EAZ55_08350 [Cytophagales bacterium]|nr:MAG: hypothetical protein EAZ55_08350 [Cytophagales bacterium]
MLHQNGTQILNYIAPPDHQEVDKQIALFDKLLRENFSQKSGLFAKNILHFLAENAQAYSAVFFILNEEAEGFDAIASYACLIEKLSQTHFSWGEGLVGQAAESRKTLSFQHLPEGLLEADFGFIQLPIHSIMVIPFMFNEKVYGVVELTLLNDVAPTFIQLIEGIDQSIAAMLESIVSHAKTQKLLEQTQEQKELLHKQETELRQNLDALAEIREALLFQNQEIEEAFKELEKKNNRIIESITYAKRIQEAILPANQRIEQLFSDYFIIYQPKDLVSGDFYWLAQTENRYYIAVVDCTGHGVPGAFMSMIANTILNQIVIEKKIHSPEQILSELHIQIRIALKQETSKNTDGMDIILCAIEPVTDVKNTYQLEFAGAKSNLYYTKSHQLYKLKGDRFSIGGLNVYQETCFTKQQIQLRKGDAIYLSTDGFVDTCNPKRKRFGSEMLEQLLKEHSLNTMEEQKQLLWEKLLQHKKDADQRDDITFLGLKL